MKLSEDYKEHECFTELDAMKDFYVSVSDASFNFMQRGTKGVVNYESYVFMAMMGTLESIATLLQQGRITDAIVLVRKFFDDILTEIYITLTLKEKFDVFNNFFVDEVNQWLESSYRIPKLKKILQIIKSSKYTKELYPFFDWDNYLEQNRQFLDDSVHANTYMSMLLNCNVLYLPGEREKQLDHILSIMRELMKTQVAFIFHLHPEYMMASDYMDSMEMGVTPPKGSENWIAPYAQDAFDKYVKPDSKLATFIKRHNPLDIQ